MILTKITLFCGNKDCKKTFVVEGANATRRELYKKSRIVNWQWKSADIQFCPDHRAVAKSAMSKTVKKAVASAPKAKKAAPKAIKAKATPKPADKPTETPAPVASWAEQSAQE